MNEPPGTFFSGRTTRDRRARNLPVGGYSKLAGATPHGELRITVKNEEQKSSQKKSRLPRAAGILPIGIKCFLILNEF